MMPRVVGSGSSPWPASSSPPGIGSSPGKGSPGTNGLWSTKAPSSNPAENGSSVSWNASSTSANSPAPSSSGRPRAGPMTYDTSHTSADNARIPSADHGGVPSPSKVRK